MRQQLSLSLLMTLIVFITVTIKVNGYIFISEEDARMFDTQLQNRDVIQFINRNEWNALPTTEPVERLVTPVPYVFIYHTGTESCYYRQSCGQIVRNLQAKYISTYPWNRDIGYNFLVSGDGKIYVGRGWRTVGAHTINVNEKSIGIAVIGTFYDKSPSIAQFHSMKNLINYGVALNFIDLDYNYYSEINGVRLYIDDHHNTSSFSEMIRHA
ncbi:peptidoglycan recognition protein-like [Cotesia typhae]|uniref:peptidoglycan recognition protein-like n=1 Tax=Cotesia typhae TaxID=2053667 RepID=UPI003D682BBA